MSKPNPNLWAVDIKDRRNGALMIALFVCAPHASSAERKARTHVEKLGYRGFSISRVEHKGTIDVF